MANRDLTPWTAGRGLTPFSRDPFGSFRQEMDRLFEDFLTLAPLETRSFGRAAQTGLRPIIDLQ
jgi:HSP20 family protein